MVSSGLIGALLSATRLAGISALPALIIHLSTGNRKTNKESRFRSLTAIILASLGLAFFCIHLHERTGDALAFIHIQRAWRGDSPALTPLGWLRSLYTALGNNSLWLYRYWAISGIIVLTVSTAFLVKPGPQKSQHRPLAMFSLVSTILPLTSDCWGLARYIWWQAPVLLTVVGILKHLRLSLGASLWLVLALPSIAPCYRQWFTPLNWYIS